VQEMNFYKFALQLLTFLICSLLINSNSFGQTVVKDNHYKAFYYDNSSCVAFNYDLTVPHLFSVGDKDIRNAVNDSIIQIAKSIRMVHLFDFNYEENGCNESMLESPDQTEMNYKVYTNNSKILSLQVFINFSAGMGGHDVGRNIFCYNIDLKNNSLIQLDSIFNKANKEKVFSLFDEQLKADNLGMEFTYKAFINFNITNNDISFFYFVQQQNMKPSISEVKLPLTGLKKYLNKSFSWTQ
jgi:hypothetical protein